MDAVGSDGSLLKNPVPLTAAKKPNVVSFQCPSMARLAF